MCFKVPKHLHNRGLKPENHKMKPVRAKHLKHLSFYKKRRFKGMLTWILMEDDYDSIKTQTDTVSPIQWRVSGLGKGKTDLRLELNITPAGSHYNSVWKWETAGHTHWFISSPVTLYFYAFLWATLHPFPSPISQRSKDWTSVKYNHRVGFKCKSKGKGSEMKCS